MVADLHPMHLEAIQSDRIHFNSVWKEVQKGVRRNTRSKFESNQLVVEFDPENAQVSVWVSHGDGADERVLGLSEAEGILRTHCLGGAS